MHISELRKKVIDYGNAKAKEMKNGNKPQALQDLIEANGILTDIEKILSDITIGKEFLESDKD